MYHWSNMLRTVSVWWWHSDTNKFNIFWTCIRLKAWDSQTPTSLTEFPVPAHHCSKKASDRPRCQGNRSKSKDLTCSLLYKPCRFEFPLRKMSKSKIIPNTCHINRKRLIIFNQSTIYYYRNTKCISRDGSQLAVVGTVNIFNFQSKKQIIYS